jgi:hypothetical protein
MSCSLGNLLSLVSGIGYAYNGPRQKLGEGLPGLMPSPMINHDGTNNFSRTRFTLRDSWNTKSYCGSSNPKRILTPFRAVNNAGDILSRDNYACGGGCQSVQSIPGIKGIKQHLGSTGSSCKPSIVWSDIQLDTTIPAGTCNVKFVYDGSDYIRFKKDQSVNKNYNDRSFNGNSFNGSQSIRRHISI